MSSWPVLAVLLSIAGFYVFLSVYILFRLIRLRWFERSRRPAV